MSNRGNTALKLLCRSAAFFRHRADCSSFDGDAVDEKIGVKAGGGNECEDFAGMYVKDDSGARFVAESVVSGLLEADVNSQIQIFAFGSVDFSISRIMRP